MEVKDVKEARIKPVLNRAYERVESSPGHVSPEGVVGAPILNPETSGLRQSFEQALVEDMMKRGLPAGFSVNRVWHRGGLIGKNSEGKDCFFPHLSLGLSKVLSRPDISSEIASVELEVNNFYEYDCESSLCEALNNNDRDYQLMFELGGVGFSIISRSPELKSGLSEYFQEFSFANHEFPLDTAFGGMIMEYLLEEKFPSLEGFGDYVHGFEDEALRMLGYFNKIKENPVFKREALKMQEYVRSIGEEL